MGLENLKSVFNDLSENTLSERGIHGGLTNERPSTPAHPKEHSLLDLLPNDPLLNPDNQSMSPTLEIKGRHGGLTNERPSIPAHPDDHSELDDIEKNLTTKLDLQTNSTAGKIVFPDDGSVDYSSLMLDNIGIHSGLNTFSQLLDENITKRTFDTTTLGKDQELGIGDYSLETLYLNNHRGSPERIQIDTGKKDWEGNAITINTGRAGMGSLGNLDIKGYSTTWRNGIGFLKEPYIVHNIPKTGFGSALQGVGQNRDRIPFRAALDDASRLAQFYTSPAGVAFMAKENITNVAIGDGVTLTEPFGAIMAPPIPVPNTGFLNFVQQPIQGAGLGSIRRPFKIQYSQRQNVSLPFKDLGDGLSLVDRLWAKTPYLDMSGFGETAVDDRIADSGVESPLKLGLTDLPSLFGAGGDAPLENAKGLFAFPRIQKGDFYVRIRDLRDDTYIYFRGYVTGMVENVNPSFTPTNYIGRSEPVYMYERAERDLSFNLRVYPANINQFDKMYEKIEKLTSLAYPEYLQDTDNSSLTRMKAPFTELYMAHIGSKVKGQFGFIKSLSYTVNETGDWDALSALPRLFDIAISYQILNRKPPSMGDKFYRASV